MDTIEIAQKYSIQPHPSHKRLRHIILENALIHDFFTSVKDIDVQRLEYVPFMRFYLAHQLLELTGREFQAHLRQLLQDRRCGGFTIGLQNQTTNTADYIKFSTAIGHMIGPSNFDAMSGKYYARFTVKHTDDSDTYLRKAYSMIKLHTDGAYLSEATDWVLMMKFGEQHASGGESRFLHLDDWEDIEVFSHHALASHPYKFSYADRKSKNVDEAVFHSVFSHHNALPCIRYNHQCTIPMNIPQAMYLKQLQDSIESSKGTCSMKLPVGDLILLNNHFWLHGRGIFAAHPELHRELLRQRGKFSDG